MLANVVAFTVGGGIAGGLLRFMGQSYYGKVTEAFEAAYVQAGIVTAATAVFGAIIGVAQWLVLRHRLRAGRWPIATCLGWALTGLIVGVFSGLAGGAISDIGPDQGPVPAIVAAGVSVALIGGVFGTFQWRILRGQVVGAEPWPVVSVGALFAGLTVAFLIRAHRPGRDHPVARGHGLSLWRRAVPRRIRVWDRLRRADLARPGEAAAFVGTDGDALNPSTTEESAPADPRDHDLGRVADRKARRRQHRLAHAHGKSAATGGHDVRGELRPSDRARDVLLAQPAEGVDGGLRDIDDREPAALCRVPISDLTDEPDRLHATSQPPIGLGCQQPSANRGPGAPVERRNRTCR